MLEVASGLAARGHDMTVVYQNAGALLTSYAEAGVHTVQGGQFAVDRSQTVRSALQLLATTWLGIRRRPELVYVNDFQHTTFGALVSTATRSALVCHLRLTPPAAGSFARQLKLSIPHVDRFIAVSEDSRERHSRAGFPRERIDVVHNGIDLSHYSPGTPAQRTSARQQLGVDEDALVIAYVGRVDAVKGVETLVDAVNALHAENPRYHLLVVGRPAWHDSPQAGAAYVEGLRHRARPGSATFLGVQLDTVPVYRAADVVVVPSQWPEPFGRAVVEAMACGRPVIASRIGGIPEILTEDLEPLLVEPGSVADLAARLAWIDGRCTDLGPRCREVATARFGLERTLDGIESSFARAAQTR